MKDDKKENLGITKEGIYYVAQGIDIDISSFGKTKQEVLKNFKEAQALFSESAD